MTASAATTLAALLAAAPQETATAAPGGPGEAAFYAVDYLTPAADEGPGPVLEVGGLDFLPDGRLALSTRRGQVWLVSDPLADDPADARFDLFAEGLWEGLGLAVVDGAIHVLQRGELSRLVDVDGDGRCDDVETIAYDWGLSENYHEFAYGLPVDADGNAYATLNVGFLSPKWWHGKATVPYRGWALRISPAGVVTPVASGFRSPCGVSLSPAGELFVTDNQGDWMPASPVFRVRPGGFHGHPASLDWTEEYRRTATLASDTIPPARAATEREPAALWLPYAWSRSPGNLAWDLADGRFGPYAGQAFVAELTNGMVLRAGFEEVEGVLQGWVLPFRRNVGSVVRVAFAPDGTLMLGFTNRGWGGLPPSDGLGRVRWTGATPFEVLDARLERFGTGGDGFALRFTRPLDAEWLAAAVADPASALLVSQHHYDYWWEYGSPEREPTALEVARVVPTADGFAFEVDGLAAGRVARIRLVGARAVEGAPLLHDELSYTVNRLRGSDRAAAPHVARIVPPPPARETGEEGWLRLTYGDATDAWVQEGWELVEAELDPDDPTRFRVSPGNSHLTNTASDSPSDYVGRVSLGDGSYHVEFTLPEGGESGVWLQGAYGIRLSDARDTTGLGPEHCGAILASPGLPARAPARMAYHGPGQLHRLDVELRAPRFDERGRKTENARLLRVRIDDVLLHENVELPGASLGAPRGEAPAGPLVLRGDLGPVAFGNVRFRPAHPEREPAPAADGWSPLIDLEADDPLAGWRATGAATWTVEDEVLTGKGARGHLFSPRGDYEDFELRARVRVSDGGNAGLLLRAELGPRAEPDDGERPAAYEAEINSSFADPNKSGSIVGIAPVRTHLVAPDTWFDYRILCRTTAEGVRFAVDVNGVRVAEGLDPDRTRAAGHVALEQQHDGSVVELAELLVREL